MNKIHSKIWNKSLGMLVVASEHARASGKGGASKRLRASLAAAGVVMALGAAPVMASDFVANAPGTSSDPSVGTGGTAGGRGGSSRLLRHCSRPPSLCVRPIFHRAGPAGDGTGAVQRGFGRRDQGLRQ